jgi:hypothetical protein
LVARNTYTVESYAEAQALDTATVRKVLAVLRAESASDSLTLDLTAQGITEVAVRQLHTYPTPCTVALHRRWSTTA